jgi:hypothetical protein
MARRKDAILSERLDSRGIRGDVCVFEKSGRYIAEYKLGAVRMPVPVAGRTAVETMAAARKWLTTSVGGS